MKRRLILLQPLQVLVVGAFLFAACSEETPSSPTLPEQEVEDSLGAVPTIAWDEPSARFRIYTDETLTLVPILTGTDSTSTYLWTRDGAVVSTESHYSFVSSAAGEYFIQLRVTNRYGSAEDEVKITVVEKEVTELPELPPIEGLCLRVPWTETNITQGRTIKVKAFLFGNVTSPEASWTIDGEPATGLADEYAFVFKAEQVGVHHLTLRLVDADTQVEQRFLLNVCPPEGTYRRPFEGQALVNQVYAFQPAPGHQVNGYIIVGDSYLENCTHEQACDSVLAHFQRRWSVSLGSQGGYLIAGFDHSVRNSSGDYDLCIKGNPYDYQSEPGIIWVSQDDNGDGLPNDQWFELAGSEYGTERHLAEYAITYYRPEARKSATAWRDCLGNTGYVPYMSYWNPHDYYWQPWIEGTEHTYYGARLADRSTYGNGVSSIPPYDWGYVDNLGSDFIDGLAGKMNYFRLANARTWDGQPANLEYIDFIRIQTAQIGSTPNLGDISTEIYYISDYHCETGGK